MSEQAEEARRLAEAWISGWQEGRPDDIPLSDDFVHESPFGRIQGRVPYLEKTKPMSRKNTTSLRILRTIGAPGEAAILFDMETPKGTIQVCDWVFVKDGEITEIRSFYDATKLRD